MVGLGAVEDRVHARSPVREDEEAVPIVRLACGHLSERHGPGKTRRVLRDELDRRAEGARSLRDKVLGRATRSLEQ